MDGGRSCCHSGTYLAPGQVPAVRCLLDGARGVGGVAVGARSKEIYILKDTSEETRTSTPACYVSRESSTLALFLPFHGVAVRARRNGNGTGREHAVSYRPQNKERGLALFNHSLHTLRQDTKTVRSCVCFWTRQHRSRPERRRSRSNRWRSNDVLIVIPTR